MTKQQIKVDAIEMVKQIINDIASKEYSKLHTITTIENSWCEDGETQIEGIESFGEWIVGQLDMWSEDEGKEIVIDTFNERYLEIDDFLDGDAHVFATYNPKSNGEPLDLWFEIQFTIDENNKLTSEFNINI